MKRFVRNNGILIVLIALLLAILLFVVSAVLGGTANPLRNLFGVVTTPLRAVSSTFADWTEGLYSEAYEREDLLDEISRLQSELSNMREQAQEGALASAENERLRNLLGLREKRRDFTFESATVTERSRSNWSATFTLSKGSNMDIAAGDCVVDEYGNLAGIVSEVGENWSTVSTVVDANFQMGGYLTRTAGAAVLEGDFTLMGEGKLKLTYLPEDTALMVGDQILTSNQSDLYPSGLIVGYIESLQSDISGTTQYAVVVPESNLEQLQQVFVITDFDIVE